MNWEGPANGPGMAILLRSAASNEFAAEKVRDVFANQVRPMVASVGDPADASRRAGLVASQLLGLAMCRYLLRLPPVVALSHEEIIRNVGPALQRYVMGQDVTCLINKAQRQSCRSGTQRLTAAGCPVRKLRSQAVDSRWISCSQHKMLG